MPNYNGKSPLGMVCPNCGKWGNHPVSRTDPKNYHWGKHTVEMFKRIAGRDITYRLRNKTCTFCGTPFDSTEIPHDHFRAIVEELLRLLSLQTELDKTRQIIDAQNEQLQKITDIAQIRPKA